MKPKLRRSKCTYKVFPWKEASLIRCARQKGYWQRRGPEIIQSMRVFCFASFRLARKVGSGCCCSGGVAGRLSRATTERWRALAPLHGRETGSTRPVLMYIYATSSPVDRFSVSVCLGIRRCPRLALGERCLGCVYGTCVGRSNGSCGLYEYPLERLHFRQLFQKCLN